MTHSLTNRRSRVNQAYFQRIADELTIRPNSGGCRRITGSGRGPFHYCALPQEITAGWMRLSLPHSGSTGSAHGAYSAKTSHSQIPFGTQSPDAELTGKSSRPPHDARWRNYLSALASQTPYSRSSSPKKRAWNTRWPPAAGPWTKLLIRPARRQIFCESGKRRRGR